MNRRRFLEGCTSGLTALFAASSDGHAARVGSSHPPREIAADLVGTEDGLAKAPCIRESRRIKAELTVVEQHVGTEARRRHPPCETRPETLRPFSRD